MSATRSSRRSQIAPVIEMLETRRMRSADLSAVFSSSIPAALETGDRNHLAIEIVNQGETSAAGKVTVDLFASSNTAGDENVLLGSISRRMNLKPDHDGKVNFHFAEPATLPDGTYSLIASVDSSAIPNVTSTNALFVAPSPVTVQQPSADLTAEMVVAPTEPITISGDSVQGQVASLNLVNRGTVKADGLVSIDFYLSTSQTLDSQAQLAGDLPYVSIDLKPGHSEIFRTALEPAIGTPSGEYFLFADAKPETGIIQKNIGDEVGLAPQKVNVINTTPVMTGTEDQSDSQRPIDYDGAVIEAPVGGTGTVQTPAPQAAPAPDNTPPTDCSTPDCDTSSNCETSTDDTTQPDDNTDQNGDNSQTQPTDPSDQQNPPADSQPSSDNSTQPSTDDSSQQATDNSQDDSSQPTDNSASTDDSSQSTDDSGDTSDSSSDDSSDSSDSGSDDSGDDGDTDSGF